MDTTHSEIRWVGHRGWPQKFPENSLQGIREALCCGAHAVEVDIQFTRDKQPVLLHDASLLRTVAIDTLIAECEYSDLGGKSAHEPNRFGDSFAPTPIAHLRELVSLMQAFPEAMVFVEVKQDVFDFMTRADVFHSLEQQLRPISSQVVFISYDLLFLRGVQALNVYPVGWVLKHFDAISKARVYAKPVDYLICNIDKIPVTCKLLWQGEWSWFMYDITQHKDLQRCKALGVQWIETWDVGAMIVSSN